MSASRAIVDKMAAFGFPLRKGVAALRRRAAESVRLILDRVGSAKLERARRPSWTFGCQQARILAQVNLAVTGSSRGRKVAERVGQT